MPNFARRNSSACNQLERCFLQKLNIFFSIVLVRWHLGHVYCCHDIKHYEVLCCFPAFIWIIHGIPLKDFAMEAQRKHRTVCCTTDRYVADPYCKAPGGILGCNPYYPFTWKSFLLNSVRLKSDAVFSRSKPHWMQWNLLLSWHT